MMDGADIKIRLSAYRLATKRMEGLFAERDRLRLYCRKLSSDIETDRVKKTSTTSHVETAIVNLSEIERHISDEASQLGEIREKVEELIGSVEDERLVTVLSWRYLHGMRWERIAVEMNYDYRHILRLHGKALQILREKLKDVT